MITFVEIIKSSIEINQLINSIDLQHATLQERLNILPQAEIYEAPRERKEDVKSGMSNVKVIETVFYLNFSIIFQTPRIIFRYSF